MVGHLFIYPFLFIFRLYRSLILFFSFCPSNNKINVKRLALWFFVAFYGPNFTYGKIMSQILGTKSKLLPWPPKMCFFN